MLRFRLKSVFVSRLDNIQSFLHVLVPILSTCGADKVGKIVI